MEDICKASYQYQVAEAPSRSEPVKKTEPPGGLWQHHVTDLPTPSLPSGNDVFFVVDYNRRYADVEVMKSAAANKIIASLENMFLINYLSVLLLTMVHNLPVKCSRSLSSKMKASPIVGQRPYGHKPMGSRASKPCPAQMH